MHVKVSLDGALLQCRQVVVSHIVTTYVIFLDDVLPRLLRALVGQIEELDVIVLQPRIFFGRVGEGIFAGTAPCAPDVEQDELALVGLYKFLQQCFAFAQFGKIVGRLQHQLVKLAVLNGEIVVVLLLHSFKEGWTVHQFPQRVQGCWL